ncbi:MAG: uridine kinase [Pseudohongiellaceae bacterium]|jgi:uridine kinase
MTAARPAARPSVFTLGLAGGSGSGKTTLARQLIQRVGTGRVVVLSHDSYYRDLNGTDPAAYNFDHPDALETSLLVEQLSSLRQGNAVDVPLYDFATHTRSEHTQRIEPRPVIIVEGILLLASETLRSQLNLRVFVDVDADVRLTRRIRRDVAERGRTPEDVLRQYESTVRPMHHKFVESSKRHAHMIIPEYGQGGPAVDVLAAWVERLLENAAG